MSLEKTGPNEYTFYGNKEQCEKMRKLYGAAVEDQIKAWYDIDENKPKSL